MIKRWSQQYRCLQVTLATLALTVVGLSLDAGANDLAPPYAARTVTIYSAMRDDLSQQVVLSQGAGVLVQVNHMKLILTAAHVTSGEIITILDQGRALELQPEQRATDHFNDIDLIAVETSAEAEFVYDHQRRLFVRALTDRDRSVPHSALPRLLAPSVPRYLPQASFLPRARSQSCEVVRRPEIPLTTGLAGFEARAGHQIGPGQSGSPLISIRNTPNLSQEALVIGVAKQYSRYFATSYFASANAIARLVDRLLDTGGDHWIQPMPTVNWRMRGGLLYRTYSDGSADYLFASDSGGLGPTPGMRNPGSGFLELGRGGVRGDGSMRVELRGGIRGDGNGRLPLRGGIRGDGSERLPGRGGIRGDGGEPLGTVTQTDPDHLAREITPGVDGIGQPHSEPFTALYRAPLFHLKPDTPELLSPKEFLPLCLANGSDPWSSYGLETAMIWRGEAARSLLWTPPATSSPRQPRYWVQASPQALQLSYQLDALAPAHLRPVAPNFPQALFNQLSERLPLARLGSESCQIRYNGDADTMAITINLVERVPSGGMVGSPIRAELSLHTNGTVEVAGSRLSQSYRPVVTFRVAGRERPLWLDIAGLFAADLADLSQEDFLRISEGRPRRELTTAYLDIAQSPNQQPERVFCRWQGSPQFLRGSEPANNR